MLILMEFTRSLFLRTAKLLFSRISFLIYCLLFATLLLPSCNTTKIVVTQRDLNITKKTHIAIVKSYNSPIYQRVIASFAIASKAPIVQYNLENQHKKAKAVAEQLQKTQPALVFTLGPLATKTVSSMLPKQPLLFALTPHHKRHLKKASKKVISGISLTRSQRYQFLTIKTLAPKTKTIGVIYDPRYSRKAVRRAKSVLKKLNMRLVAAKVETNEDIENALQLFEGRIDALWQIADPSVTPSFKHLRRFTFKGKIPFFVLSEKFTQSGALVSVSIDYPSIGLQAAQMSNSFIYDKQSIQQIGIQPPKRLQITLNITTAQRIGVGCTIAISVMRFAARNRFPLKIYR